MNVTVGLVGLPNAGKSTLFNALTNAKALVADYPFSTIEPNHGVVKVPDERIDQIARIINPKDIISATIEIIDIAGLVRGSSKGEGLGNKFLGYIRDVNVIAFIIRCFNDTNLSHVNGKIDPLKDIEILKTELCLADLISLEKQIQKVKRNIANGLLEKEDELNLLLRLQSQLNQGRPVRLLNISDPKEIDILDSLNLLTKKPVVYVANIGEDELGKLKLSDNVDAIRLMALDEKAGMAIICAKFENELVEVPTNETTEYMNLFGLKESGLVQFIKESYKLLNLITFFTYGEHGLRAWSTPQNTKAPQAAGMIHSDMERGFIRIEVINTEEFVTIGSMDIARKKGIVGLEGKDYIIKDGDIIYIKFKV